MKTYTEAQVLAALKAALDDVMGTTATKPTNLANRIQGLLSAASPELLSDLAAAFEAVADKHPGPAGECVRSLATETLAEAYNRSTARTGA